MYKNLKACVDVLEANNELVRIKETVSTDLEMAYLHRLVQEKDGPALLFENVEGSPFPALSNLYGTWKRTHFLFKESLPLIQELVKLKVSPEAAMKRPLSSLSSLIKARFAHPKKVNNPKVLHQQISVDQLPGVKSWKMDGGTFITLPQVMSWPAEDRSIMKTNIGMYRIQLDGNNYEQNKEVGLHYQIHRGIGVHHKDHQEKNKPFKVSIAVGGPPAHNVAAIMPLPEGMSEVIFSGLLGKRRYRYGEKDGYLFSADADFVILGEVMTDLKPEGPFGDHLGYYSLDHPFPYLKVHEVWARKGAIWNFTVVGRPPAEDSNFGKIIHEIAGGLTASEYPGLKAVHAVDASGVHPLLLAEGSERYMPFRDKRPEEILTIANHLLGKGQTSLAKFLFITAKSDKNVPDIHDIPAYFGYLLERVNWSRDVHFYTNWSIDTLDYSGDGWNSGSKVVIAACDDKVRNLGREKDVPTLSAGEIQDIKMAIHGVLLVETSSWKVDQGKVWSKMCEQIDSNHWPMIVLVDDATFASKTLNNFLWVTFTRANPSHDIYGVDDFIENKHWGCRGSLIIDARIKPHHAPPLIDDENVVQAVKTKFSDHPILGKYFEAE